MIQKIAKIFVLIVALALTSPAAACTYHACLVACDNAYGVGTISDCSGTTCNCYRSGGAWLGGFDLFT